MIITNNNHKTSARPAFGNAAVLNGFMNYLATNQAIGASATDMGFMVIPRTAIDSTRTPEAGIETGRRELASCLLYAGMGFFGLGAARLIGLFSNSKKYDVPLHKINAGSSVIDTLAHSWNNSLGSNRDLVDKNGVIKNYLNEVFDSVSGLSGTQKTSLNATKETKEIKDELVKELSELLTDVKNNKEYAISKDKKFELVQKIIHATGAGEHLSLDNKTKTIEVNGKKQFEQIKLSAGDLLDNTYAMGRTFLQDKVAAEFKNADKITDNKFIKSLKQFNSKKMVIGLGAASAVALAMQAVNRMITKKKTGSGGFQVYKDQNGSSEKPKKDTSTLFKVLKGASAAAMGVYAFKMIGGKLKDLPKKIEFTKVMPNMNQYKFIYAVSIIGRLLAATDKNELRETSTRDFLGFTSWLVLGDLAAKTVARHFEKNKGVKLLNCEDETAKGFDRLKKTSVKTHEELLYTNKEALGKSVRDASKVAAESSKKALKYLNIAQASGYAFSGLLLGVFIPMLNKVITNKLHERALEKKQAQSKIAQKV